MRLSLLLAIGVLLISLLVGYRQVEAAALRERSSSDLNSPAFFLHSRQEDGDDDDGGSDEDSGDDDNGAADTAGSIGYGEGEEPQQGDEPVGSCSGTNLDGTCDPTPVNSNGEDDEGDGDDSTASSTYQNDSTTTYYLIYSTESTESTLSSSMISSTQYSSSMSTPSPTTTITPISTPTSPMSVVTSSAVRSSTALSWKNLGATSFVIMAAVTFILV